MTGFRRALASVALLMALGGCGGEGGDTGADDPLLRPGEKPAVPVAACQSALRQGHNLEAGGTPTPEAFLPSLENCATLSEWTASAKASGINLNGLEARFVNVTCQAAPPEVRARTICQEAAAQDVAHP